MEKTKAPMLRVIQMNGIYFDKEISKIVYEHVKNCWSHLEPTYAALFGDEINLLVNLIIQWNSIWKCDTTFGLKLLCVKYENLTTIKKSLLTAALLVEYIMDKILVLNNNIVINWYIIKLKAFIEIFRLINISLFLRNGVKPRPLDRVLGLDTTYSTSDNVPRDYNMQYVTRELLWDTFIEIFIYVIPLINIHKIKRMAQYFNPFHKESQFSEANLQGMMPININTRCVYCSEFPVLPHHMGCGHAFCYTCLKGNQIADVKYKCPTCRFNNRNICERLV